eukprot:Skav229469  [mRNA]  locus=scaffold6310:25646:28121:- [translate_table: standard]
MKEIIAARRRNYFARLQSRPPCQHLPWGRKLRPARSLRAPRCALGTARSVAMLIPMPSMPFGTYSSYAKSRQYTILTLLVLQSSVVLLRWALDLRCIQIQVH